MLFGNWLIEVEIRTKCLLGSCLSTVKHRLAALLSEVAFNKCLAVHVCIIHTKFCMKMSIETSAIF